MRTMNIGATGMLAQQTNVEVISNNIANMSTTGFKRQRAEFQDLLYQQVRRVGSTSSDAGTILPSGIQLGSGVKTASVYRINEQGNFTVTDNPLDMAINGRGFFQVQMPDGTTAYSRAGSFQVNAEGAIVSADGYPVLPQATIPAGTVGITINASGQIQAKIDGQTTPSNVGQLQLATFPNPAGLESLGENLLRETPASGSPVVGNPQAVGFGNVVQGSLETSNVNIVSEITNLITAQRAYEMNSRVIRTADEMSKEVSNLR
ncbi:MAG: flagellar basal-body rod protein FlgG [Alphaproteobacteria bacterium]|nr:MAG: flagellar basal-body rod protein FlgG [Alphaproteobacteria bacterium]